MPTIERDPLALSAGSLRHSIDILQRTVTSSPTGAVETWSKLMTVRAAIEPVRGMELIRAGQDVSQLMVTMTMRYAAGIVPSMRIQHDGNLYLIQSVNDVQERHRVLKLLCLGIGSNE